MGNPDALGFCNSTTAQRLNKAQEHFLRELVDRSVTAQAAPPERTHGRCELTAQDAFGTAISTGSELDQRRDRRFVLHSTDGHLAHHNKICVTRVAALRYFARI